MSPFKSLFFVICITGMGMFLVWQRAEARRIGYESASLQRRALQLEEENRRIMSEVCALKSPQLVAQKVESMQLGLVEADVSAQGVSEAKPEQKDAHAATVASTRPVHGSAPATHAH